MLAARLAADGHPNGDVYLTRDEIMRRVEELGAELAEVYAGREPLLVAPLKSSAVFLTDLSRALPVPHAIDFLELAAYASGRSGGVKLLKDLDTSIVDRHVLIVEDVVDSGLTLKWLLRNLATRRPRSLKVCTLLRKPDAVRVDLDIEYVGFDIPNEFVVGYGLDYAERYRDLPYIGTLDPKVYEEL